MLRLRPSELTMTPEDVDDTFRRIARRQTSRATTNVSSRVSGYSGRPILRRGPQRSTRDAITALANIPILNPSPQQAVYICVDEDIDDSEAQAEEAPSVNHVDSVHGTSPPIQSGQTASVLTATSSVLRGMHLPFRVRHRRTSNSESTPDEQVAEASPQPPTDSFDNAALDQATIPSPNNADVELSSSRPGGFSDSPAELRGGGRPRRHRIQGSVGDASRTPSPLHQMERPRSSRAQESSPPAADSQESPSESQPTLYLEGYWKDPLMSPVDIHYHFREMMPRTEPRRRSGRQPMFIRSLSSGSAPAYAGPTLQPDPSGSSTDMFGNVPAPEPPTRPRHAPSQWVYESSSDLNNTHTYPPSVVQGMFRWRQYSSATSNASAFSYYGSDLPDSQHPSREPSGPDQLSQSQYDGAVVSRHVSRSSHRPPRQLEGGASSEFLLRPPSSRGSSQSSPNLGSSIQHGISPLPSMPYTRMNSVQSHLQPSTGFVPSDNTARSYVDAATAAAQDLRSPLDEYSEQYQRSLRTQYARQTMPAQPSAYQPELDGVNTFRQHQGMDSHHHNTTYRSPWADFRQLPPPVLPSTHRSHEQAFYPPQPYQRSRTNQGSSENMPVNPTFNEARSARRGRVATQTAAYEQVHVTGQPTQAVLPGPSRSSIFPPPAPRDVSNRPRRQAPPHQSAPRRRSDAISINSPHPFLNPRQSPQTHTPPPEAVEMRLPPARLPSMLPRQPSRLPHTSQSQRIHPRPPFRQPSTLHLDPTRDIPSTSLALDHGSGTTSRHSRSPVVRTGPSTRMRPRVPAHQRDQENSGEGERALMRREEEAINARYGEEEQREVMDETPPRVGRVERRMFE